MTQCVGLFNSFLIMFSSDPANPCKYYMNRTRHKRSDQGEPQQAVSSLIIPRRRCPHVLEIFSPGGVGSLSETNGRFHTHQKKKRKIPIIFDYVHPYKAYIAMTADSPPRSSSMSFLFMLI